MAESDIRTAMFNILSGVSRIGKVYDYERLAVDWAKFIRLFKYKNKILGWEIGRRSATEDSTSVKTYKFVIRGYMGVKDSAATEKTFNALVESVAAAFRADKDLSGAALGHGYIQVETIDMRTFGSVLCHYAEMSIEVYEHNE